MDLTTTPIQETEKERKEKYRCWIEVEAGSVDEAVGKAERDIRKLGFTDCLRTTPTGERLNYMMRKEMVWYRKFWSWLFPRKNELTEKRLKEIIKELKKNI